MLKYGGQVERISHKRCYTVLQQKQRNIFAVMNIIFVVICLYYLFVIVKPRRKEKYTYQNVVLSYYILHVFIPLKALTID